MSCRRVQKGHEEFAGDPLRKRLETGSIRRPFSAALLLTFLNEDTQLFRTKTTLPRDGRPAINIPLCVYFYTGRSLCGHVIELR